ncbi:hypothetical protein AX17_004925 [Amanita inopinata Kibby_2008]|nr:hypothetical protein AX17_004925 [Amanita inopinata Kibby_2008]
MKTSDLECLERLERQMFERSKAAGPAGSLQWGLDVGDYQDHWNPYLGIPLDWNLEDMGWEESESEHTCGPTYVEVPIKEKTPIP